VVLAFRDARQDASCPQGRRHQEKGGQGSPAVTSRGRQARRASKARCRKRVTRRMGRDPRTAPIEAPTLAYPSGHCASRVGSAPGPRSGRSRFLVHGNDLPRVRFDSWPNRRQSAGGLSRLSDSHPRTAEACHLRPAARCEGRSRKSLDMGLESLKIAVPLRVRRGEGGRAEGKVHGKSPHGRSSQCVQKISPTCQGIPIT
jgi:hypothetical protein